MLFQHEDTKLTKEIIGCAIDVLRELGPGLLESVYEECLSIELQKKGIRVARQLHLSVIYKGRPVASSLRLDLIAGVKVIVEIKSVEHLLAVHRAQLLSYLRLANFPSGLLINFNVPLLKDGIKRVLNLNTLSSDSD